MSIDRRDLFKGAALLAGTAGLLGQPPSRAANTSRQVGEKGARLLLDRLLNQAQAQAVMEEFNLAGMISADPINVYYLTNSVPFANRSGRPFSAFATLPRDFREPTFLISSTSELWDLANEDRWTPEYVPVSYPTNGDEYRGDDPNISSAEPEAGGFRYYINEAAGLTPREARWAEAQATATPAATMGWGLVRALKDSGMVRGRIAVDDMRIKQLVEEVGFGADIEFVDGENLFRKVRHVKSKTEIELMRLASGQNAAAAVQAVKNVELGMNAHDLEALFMQESAANGNGSRFFLSGFPLAGFANETVEKGKPFLIDAVSHFHGYLGDFGRTVVMGEPDVATMNVVKAQLAARDAVFGVLKPGTKYSQVREAGSEAFKKAGGNPATFFVTPHSVGLQHSDQPYDERDIVLKAGMTITVDLPYVEVGVGAGHNEDVLLITDDGFEQMNTPQDSILIV